MKYSWAVLSFLFLTACGFQPLYEKGGESSALVAQLTEVEVAPIADRLGQILRNDLVSRFGEAQAAYRLEIILDQAVQGFGFRSDASVSQEELTITARFKLIDLNGEEVIFSDSVRARTAYDLVQSDFATVAQREDTAKRLVHDIASRVERRLALYFSGQAGQILD